MAEFSTLTLSIIEEATTHSSADYELAHAMDKGIDMLHEIIDYLDSGKCEDTKKCSELLEKAEKLDDLLDKGDFHFNRTEITHYIQILWEIIWIAIETFVIAIGLGMIPGIALLLGYFGTAIAAIFLIKSLFNLWQLFKHGAPTIQVKQELTKLINEAVKDIKKSKK